MHNCDYLLALDPAGDSNSFIHLPQFPKCVFGRVNLHSVEYLQVLFMQVFFFFQKQSRCCHDAVHLSRKTKETRQRS